MMQFILDVVNGAENAVIIVCVIIGLNLVKKAVGHIKDNTENEKVKRWLTEIEDAFETAVKAVNQTLVDGLKYNDAFDAAAQEAARKEAKKVFLQVLSAEARVYLSNAYANMDAFIAAGIEKHVADAKAEKQGNVLVSEGILVDDVVTVESMK